MQTPFFENDDLHSIFIYASAGTQANNQVGAPGMVKSFMWGAQIF